MHVELSANTIAWRIVSGQMIGQRLNVRSFLVLKRASYFFALIFFNFLSVFSIRLPDPEDGERHHGEGIGRHGAGHVWRHRGELADELQGIRVAWQGIQLYNGWVQIYRALWNLRSNSGPKTIFFYTHIIRRGYPELEVLKILIQSVFIKVISKPHF